jgi:hypothetical protein
MVGKIITNSTILFAAENSKMCRISLIALILIYRFLHCDMLRVEKTLKRLVAKRWLKIHDTPMLTPAHDWKKNSKIQYIALHCINSATPSSGVRTQIPTKYYLKNRQFKP